MKIKILILLIFMVGLILPALADDIQVVSITEDQTQFMAVPANENVIYSYASTVPQNGILVLSIANNDTYMVNDGITIQMVTVTKTESKNIIDIILGWL